MTDTITLNGIIATPPRHVTTNDGLDISSFRLASTQRRFDRPTQHWVDGDTNWFTVTAFRRLAVNSATSLQKGQRVIVTGRLRVRDWTADDRAGTNVEVDADAIGHDLSWGTTVFTRTVSSAAPPQPGAEPPAWVGEPTTDASAAAEEASGEEAPAEEEAPAGEATSRAVAGHAETDPALDEEREHRLAVPF